MKKIIFLGISVMLAVIVGVGLKLIQTNNHFSPQPTEVIIVEKDDRQSHLDREKWIEQIHKAAPGVDWRQIDLENTIRLREERSALRRLKSGQGPITIGNGRLQGEWNEKGSHNLAGRMHCIEVDFENNHIYGASSGGQIWRGNLEGKNWVSLSDYNQVKGIVFLRVFKRAEGGVRIMMANNNNSLSGARVFQYSDDDGETWLGTSGLSRYNGGNLVRAVSKPDGTIYLLMRSGGRSYLLRSTNLGESFSVVDNVISSPNVDIWTPRFDNGSVYFIDKDKLMVLNGQDLFEEAGNVSLNFSSDEIEKIQLNGCISEGTAYLYVMYRLEKATRFFGSNNGGASWTARGDLNRGPFMSNSFGVSTVNPLLMGFGEVNSYRSLDGGNNWQLINSWGEYYGNVAGKLHADVPEVEFFRTPDGGEWCFVSTDGGSYKSTNNLDGVQNISLEGLHVSQYYSTYTNRENPSIIYVGSQDQGFQRTIEETDGVANFEQTISGDYAHIVSGDGGKSLWTVYPGFAMRYANAVSGNSAVMWDFTGENHFWLPPLMADPYFPEKVFIGGGTTSTGNHLWSLDHRSAGIIAVELPYDFSANTDAMISAMAYSPINKDYRYVLNSYGKFFYSSDRGTSWEKSSNRGPGSHYFHGSCIIPDVNDINTIYLGGSGYSGHSVWVSHDGGKSFDPMSQGLPNSLVFEMAINEDGTLLFAASEVGPFVWIASENEWFDLAGGVAPEQTYWTVDYVPAIRTARFGTYGRGIWDFRVTEYTGINELFAHQESMGLNIYPNPAVGFTNIEATLPLEGDLSIRLMNAAGQQLMEHYESRLPIGPYSYQLDMQPFSPGIYYVQVISGKRTTVRKLIRQ